MIPGKNINTLSACQYSGWTISWWVFTLLCYVLTEVLQSWRVQFDSPISTVLLFGLSCRATETSGDTCTVIPLRKFDVCVVCDDDVFSVVGEEMEGYNLLITSTVEMAVIYRLGHSSTFPFMYMDRAKIIRCFLCVCSEMSRTMVCLGPRVCQRAISQMLFFVRWPLTWTLTDRKRCCWEHMDRYGQNPQLR